MSHILAQSDGGYKALDVFVWPGSMALAILLHNLGTLANDRGDPGRADDYFEQALGEARQMGDRAQASRILANLGALHNRDHRAGASPGGLATAGFAPIS
ncbi:MAG: tetratricopeptide repeat protein [Anaerolineales bacterium]